MKKIMISLLMVAATINAFAISYTGKATLTLKSSDNKSCTMTIGESADLNAGLNNGYYAELNEEGKAVQLYALYGDKKYQIFVSDGATMSNLQLGIKTNSSTNYTLTATDVIGAMEIRINGVDYTITEGMSEAITLPANSVLPAAGDEASYKINPVDPLAPSLCFRYNVLEVNGHDGESLIIKQGDAEIANVPALGNAYSKDLSGYNGRLVVTLNGQDYQIDANPAVTPAN